MERHPGSKPEKNLGQNVVVIQLASPLQGSERNVTMDNYFSGVPLAKTMLQRKLTIVGTMHEEVQKINSRVYDTCKVSRNEDIDLWFQRPTHNGQLRPPKKQSCNAVKYDAPPNKHWQRRPQKEIKDHQILHQTKIGVDPVDQMVGTYTCRRQTRRWPLKLFFNLLDVAALNAYTVYRQVHPDQQSNGGSRRRFLTDLANSLILPDMKTRQKIPQLQKATKEAMMRCG